MRMSSFSRLKELIHAPRVIQNEDSFSKSLENAVSERKSRIKGIYGLIQSECSYSAINIQSAKTFCNNLLDNKVTLLMVGPTNSGKSLLVSELIDREYTSLSSQEPTTKAVTRIVYSPERKLKIIETTGKGYSYKETTVQAEETTKSYYELLQEKVDVFSIDEEDETLSRIIEIGIPSEILKSGLQIIDCPGFDQNDILISTILNQLYLFRPSIVCYVYDYHNGFRMKDLNIISRIHEALNKLGAFNNNIDHNHCTQYILVANKCDQLDANNIDSEYNNSVSYLSETYIHDMGRWKLANDKRFPFDTDKLLPGICMSAGEILLEMSSDGDRQILELQNRILNKVVEQIRFITDIFAHYLLKSEPHGLPVNIQYVQYKPDIFFALKSANVEAELIDLVETDCQPKKLILDFHCGYKVYGLGYRGRAIQVTEILLDNQRKNKLFHDLYFSENSRQSIVYLSVKTNAIYVIDKEIPSKRLIDSLHEFDSFQIQNFIKQIIDKYRKLSYYNLTRNFRIDNVYIDDNGAIYINRNVPNLKPFKLIFKDGRQFELPAVEGDIHPDYAGKTTDLAEMTVHDTKMKCMEFIRSFSWSLCVLQRKENIPQFETEKFIPIARCPNYLEDVIRLCRTLEQRSELQDVLNFWNQKICPMIDANIWIKEKSNLIEPDLTDLLNSKRHQNPNLSLDFTGGFEIFGCNYRNSLIQVTRLSRNNNDEMFTKLKESIYKRNRKDLSARCYESEDERRVFLIDREVKPHRLLDHLQHLDLEEIKTLISNVANQMIFTEEAQEISNFRADCIFIDDNKNSEVFLNRNIPNEPHLPFLLNKKFCAKPFHLHPSIRKLPITNDRKIFSKKILRIQKEAVEFLYSFGWFVWLLIEGSGNPSRLTTKNDDKEMTICDRLNCLESGKFSIYPDYLKAIMMICWSVQHDDDLRTLHQSWNDCLSLLTDCEDSLKHHANGGKILPSLLRKETSNIPSSIYNDEYYDREKEFTPQGRGLCLIICNEFFQNHVPREGAMADKAILEDIFTMFNYKVIVKENLKLTEMKEEIFEISRRDHSRFDSFVIYIMSHGNEGLVYASDDCSVKLKDALEPLYKCDTLLGKPKLVFIQACRGEIIGYTPPRVDGGAGPDTTEQREQIAPNNPTVRERLFEISALSLKADFLLAQSTIPQHASFRSVDAKGSYFIQTLAKRLIEVGKTCDILHILTAVTRMVNQKAFEEIHCHQIASFESRLMKLFKFSD